MEKVTDIARINSLLKRLLESRTLITIKVEGYKQAFSTAIIKLSPTNDYLLLDELKPENGNELLKETNKFSINAQLDGVRVKFSASISEFGDEDGLLFYKTQLPMAIDYHQRRAAVRIKLSAANPVAISLISEENITFDGEISDLSLGGLGFQIKHSESEKLTQRQTLKCTFQLPHDKKLPFTTDVIIRIIKHDGDKTKRAFIGCQFKKLDKNQERQLQRAIMTLQRNAQKNR